jgi:hypothetical protein
VIRGIDYAQTLPKFRSWSLYTFWHFIAVFSVTFPVLAFHAAPSVTFHDSGEFALAHFSNGLPHSPGAPTWAILTRIFSWFTFGAEAARTTNLFSSFCGALTISFAACFVYRHFADRPNSQRWLAGAIVAGSVMATGAFLEQSFVTEQYTLMTAFMTAILLVIQTNDARPKLKNFIVLGLLWGLALGNHPSQLILGPLMLLVCIQNRKSIAIWKTILCGVLGFILGLSVFAYIPYVASQNPLMNWGHPNTKENFLFSVFRQQWDKRAVTSAPVGFIREWFTSFDFISQMGWLGTSLGICGAVLSWRRASKAAIWVAMLVIPYTLALLYGHLNQAKMDTLYIRFYGVIDWHIPVYLGLSIFASFGVVWLLDMRRKCTQRARVITMVTVLLGFIVTIPGALSEQSLRDNKDSDIYIKGHFDILPKNAIIAAFNDNGTAELSYARYAKNIRPDLYVTYGPYKFAYDLLGKKEWTMESKKFFLKDFIHRPIVNPLTLPMLSDVEIESRPFFTEYESMGDDNLNQYLLPTGYLFELRTTKVTDQEIRNKYHEIRSAHPEMYALPGAKANRLAREAFSYTHLRLGLFFRKRALYNLAFEEFKIAYAWQKKNPLMCIPLAGEFERQMKFVEAETCYKDAIEGAPYVPGARQNLAILYILAKQYKQAFDLVVEELKLGKPNPTLLKLKADAEKGLQIP